MCPARILRCPKSLHRAPFPMTSTTLSTTTPSAGTRKPFTLRDATPADVPAIHAIYAHHVLHGRASFEEAPPSLDEMQ